jgi:hypothetical protein
VELIGCAGKGLVAHGALKDAQALIVVHGRHVKRKLL